MSRADWTPEQLDNAMRYGVCLVCRSPREAKLTRNGEEFDSIETPPRRGDGYSYEHSLVCPNGHPQD